MQIQVIKDLILINIHWDLPQEVIYNYLKYIKIILDKLIDKAAIIMRMLFLKDLRELQTSIDQTIVRCQVILFIVVSDIFKVIFCCYVKEYTANPKTDSRLGRVGR